MSFCLMWVDFYVVFASMKVWKNHSVFNGVATCCICLCRKIKYLKMCTGWLCEKYVQGDYVKKKNVQGENVKNMYRVIMWKV